MSPALAQRFASNTLLSGPAGGAAAPASTTAAGRTRSPSTWAARRSTSRSSATACPTVTTEGEIGGHRDRLADPRHPHHRRRRRLDRLDRHRRPARGRPGQRGRRPRARVLRPRRHAADGDRRRPAARLPGPDASSTAASCSSTSTPRRARSGTLADAARPRASCRSASGIYELVNANMAAALGVVSVERGHDPREFVLVVAGGAGPIHAAAIARELEIPHILDPARVVGVLRRRDADLRPQARLRAHLRARPRRGRDGGDLRRARERGAGDARRRGRPARAGGADPLRRPALRRPVQRGRGAAAGGLPRAPRGALRLLDAGRADRADQPAAVRPRHHRQAGAAGLARPAARTRRRR